jgi:hypothetical protein
MDKTDKDELVQEIGRMLVQDPRISALPWRQVAIVAQITDDSTQVNGFVYDETGKETPTAPKNTRVIDRFEELRSVMGEHEESFWSACLVRLDRVSGKISIDFEYDHPEKWLITPSTVKEMSEKLRPAK